MAGHSKWAQIKHKKKIVDAKRGSLFTKIIKEITVAARLGGGDPGGNSRLRLAVTKAKGVNMPADNIDRAIKKGTGELPGVSYEEVTYEGYGAGGVAVMAEVMTDNKTRTVAEIRNIFGKAGGQMGETGCVSWVFNKKGEVVVDKAGASEDTVMEIALDAGAEDMDTSGDTFNIFTPPAALEAVKAALEARGVKVESAELGMIPINTVKVDSEDIAKKVLRLMETLEDHDDVQKVHANFDIPDEILERATA
ncbi:MAG: YebC/PmpR family DNA-binding transcriptional regulator [Nitrospinae bacterium]|nr:YebC/PmpR family DNA-binding transcriptional regulator [Nitrospinota bacterium]